MAAILPSNRDPIALYRGTRRWENARAGPQALHRRGGVMMEEPLDTDRRVSAAELMMFRMEEIPSARSSGIGVSVLDCAPDFERLTRAYQRASPLFVRLRQRIVVPALQIGSAEWVTDPDFDLTYHLRRVRVPEPGTLRQVFDLAETLAMVPFDRARPLWETTLVEGLAGGRAAMLVRQHHSISDGMCSVSVSTLLYDTERNPPDPRTPPRPPPAASPPRPPPPPRPP